MKKLFSLMLAILILLLPAFAESKADSVTLRLEDGFSIELPADWVSFSVDPELAQSGYIYCLGSSDGAQRMYIQRWASDLEDMDALQAAMDARPEIETHSRGFSDYADEFMMYSFVDSDASGCLMLFRGSILNFIFTPQSSPDLMLVAANVAANYCDD